MQFTSTRNKNLSVKFSQAVLQCSPTDGGVFIPAKIEDFRRWISYIDETTSFTSIAGSITSALINDEFSPIICEKIATQAFPISPIVRQIDEKLFLMELCNGFTGYHRDYGVSYLCSYLESTLELKGGNAIFLDFSHGSLGAVLSKVLKGKKNIKAIILYEKNTVRGIDEEDLFWNGGNIFPIQMDYSENKIKELLSDLFLHKEFINQNNITVANTTNVCRLLSQIFFFPYSFAQIKKKVNGDIFYAMEPGNYGTLMAGLYSWRFALPVSGFFIPSTKSLTANPSGNPEVVDSIIDLLKRNETNPIIPANLERLEDFFENNEKMMRNFVYPQKVNENEINTVAKELFIKYGIYSDKGTASAYSVIKKNESTIFEDDAAVVLTQFNHPSLSKDFCTQIIGETPKTPDFIEKSLIPYTKKLPTISSIEELKQIIQDVNSNTIQSGKKWISCG